MLTIPILLLIVLNYNFNLDKSDSSGDPTEEIFKDKFVLSLGVAFVLILFLCIYLKLGV